MLHFAEATYTTKETYGFEVAAAVPVYNPLHSWNYFTLEFGYDLPEGGWSSRR